MGSAILIVTFENQEQGEIMLETMRQWKKQKEIELGDAVVIVKDEEGQVKVHETSEFTTRHGAVTGGVAGLVVGTVLGGPVGGLLLGAAAGALAGKKIDLGISNDEIAAVSDSMHSCSSAIALQIESVKHKEMLAAAIRQYDGTVHELSLTDDLQMDLEQVAVHGSMR